MTDVFEDLPGNATVVKPKIFNNESPEPVDVGLEAVNKCLAAAAYSLKFDIAELWRFAPDTARRSTGKPAMATPSMGLGASKPSCEHVYAQSAILKTYTGRIAGIWKSGFDDSQLPQHHVLSPSMCEQTRASECPLWFTSSATRKLHPSLPLNTVVVLPVHLDDMYQGDENTGDYIAVFLSLQLLERNRLSLDFLGYISKAATTLFIERRGTKGNPREDHNNNIKDMYIETHLRDVPVVTHPGEQVNTAVEWSDLRDVEFLVNGSRCTIYTAMYKEHSVVVKLMRKDVRDASAVRRELELELELLRRIRHENVVRLLGAGTDPEQFLVITRLDGGTLAQRCHHGRQLRDRRGRFSEKKQFTYMELLRCARQLAEGLRYLHEEAIPGRMVVHRDLKPDNIGFSESGDVKLLDLGLSRLVSKSEMDNAMYKMTGETGSARYMAPEVAESRPYNEKVDVYSYGMVLWEMTALKKPFDRMDRDQFFAQVVRDGARPPINKKWPKDWSNLMQTCWDEDVKKRPSFSKVGDRLQTMLQDGIHKDLHKLQPSRPSLMSKLGLKNRHSSWF